MPPRKKPKYTAVVTPRHQGENLYTDNRGVTANYHSKAGDGNGFRIIYPTGYVFEIEDLPLANKKHVKDGASLPVLQALINKAVSLEDDPLHQIAHTFLTIGMELLMAKESADAAANKVQYRDKDFIKIMHGVIACNVLDHTPTYGNLENMLEMITSESEPYVGKVDLTPEQLNFINELEKRDIKVLPPTQLNSM